MSLELMHDFLLAACTSLPLDENMEETPASTDLVETEKTKPSENPVWESVACRFHSKGCAWMGCVHQREEHEKMCKLREFVCPSCQVTMPYTLRQMHYQYDCVRSDKIVIKYNRSKARKERREKAASARSNKENVATSSTPSKTSSAPSRRSSAPSRRKYIKQFQKGKFQKRLFFVQKLRSIAEECECQLAKARTEA